MAIKPKPATRYFKIRNAKTGLWSHGKAGYGNSWTSRGKIWRGTGPLRLHMTLAIGHGHDISDWEVVEYTMQEVGSKPAHEMIDLIKILKKKNG